MQREAIFNPPPLPAAKTGGARKKGAAFHGAPGATVEIGNRLKLPGNFIRLNFSKNSLRQRRQTPGIPAQKLSGRPPKPPQKAAAEQISRRGFYAS